jgi:hypothetical protein
MNTDNKDRLYELLPAIYRMRDHEQGEPLRALLQVIAEQVNVVEHDIFQLYENWFIETCEDWVVPYISDLIGYQPVHEAGEPGEAITPQERLRNRILIPRREVANTIRYRRRKGTLALLELLANDVAGWPARAVEFFKLLGWTQALNYQRSDRGRTVDLRHGDALDRVDGPFDEMAHTVDVRRINSHHSVGRYNIPSVGLYVWRLKIYSVTQTPAFCLDERPYCYTFSILGNDAQLYHRPYAEDEPTHIAEEVNLPVPIRRRWFEAAKGTFYGRDLQIWVGEEPSPSNLIEENRIIVADLKDWKYFPRKGYLAVDPERGRIAFSPRHAPDDEVVWVSYYYAFSADIGGGEYRRALSQPESHQLYRVGRGENSKSIREALKRWSEDQEAHSGDPEKKKQLQHAVIEITDSGLYEEVLDISLAQDESLQIRAASNKRPVISVSEQHRAKLDAIRISGERGSRLMLDGLLIVGRGLLVTAPHGEKEYDQIGIDAYDESGTAAGEKSSGGTQNEGLASLTLRHSTLVPGWTLDPECEPQQPAEPSLLIRNVTPCVVIEHSIVGSIQVEVDEVTTDPLQIRVSDSVLDATGIDCDDPMCEALSTKGSTFAHAVLTVVRSTVFGHVYTHAIELAENSIFMGLVRVARRQRGCMRFCYVTPGSRTPKRYNCQPDLVEQAVQEEMEELCKSAKEKRLPGPTNGEIKAAKQRERQRVRPQFNSMRYGMPTYCQLASACAEEIIRGSDDQSEMGVFHDLYQPQRTANLRARLEEYTPAGADVGIIFSRKAGYTNCLRN